MRRLPRWTGGLVAVWVLGSGVAGAQAADPHAALPERPSVATHAHTVAPGWLEIEAGWRRVHDDGQFGDADLPFSVKLGLTRRLQLTLTTAVTRPTAQANIDDAALAVKWRLSDHVPIAGTVAVLPSVVQSTSSSDMGTTTAVGVVVISSRSIGALTLDLNAGYSWNSGDGSEGSTSATLWAASFGGPIAGRFSWGGELYGFPATSGSVSRDAIVASTVGTSAMVKPSIVLDVSLVIPISGPESYAVLGGMAWNVGALWGRRPIVP